MKKTTLWELRSEGYSRVVRGPVSVRGEIPAPVLRAALRYSEGGLCCDVIVSCYAGRCESRYGGGYMGRLWEAYDTIAETPRCKLCGRRDDEMDYHDDIKDFRCDDCGESN